MNTVNTIDTLTFYSTGLDAEITVCRERRWPLLELPRPDPEAIARLHQQIADAVNRMSDEVTAAFAAMWPAFNGLWKAIEPYARAAHRCGQVLHRWSDPDLYADMWDRKTARTSRAWTMRSVGR